MTTAGITIDPWKLEIFDRHLKGAGLAYVKTEGLIEGHAITILQVQTNDLATLRTVVMAANREAASKSGH